MAEWVSASGIDVQCGNRARLVPLEGPYDRELAGRFEGQVIKVEQGAVTIAHRNHHPRRFARQDVLIRHIPPADVADPPVRAPRETPDIIVTCVGCGRRLKRVRLIEEPRCVACMRSRVSEA